MNITLFISLLFGLQILYWLVGRRAAKNLQEKQDYFLAGKSVRLFPLMMTFLATQVGGGIVLGAADEAYMYGWPVLLYPMGAALGLILLGLGIGRRLSRFEVTTVAQIFEVVYRSAMLKRVASLLSIISLFMILVAQIIASSKFLASLGFSSIPLFIAFWAIVILYTAQGGLKAVISTDMLQAGFFTLIFLFCFICVAIQDPTTLQLSKIQGFAAVSSKLWGWLLMPLFFMVIEQDMGQRCFAGATPRVVSQASLLAGIGTLLVCVVPVFFGALARAKGLIIPPGASVLMTAVTTMTNPWISAIVGCAILAAIISTATSLINAISSNLANDFNFLQRVGRIRLVQAMTGLISIAALLFAFQFNNIVDLLIQSYELSVSCLFVPIFIALFKKEGSFFAALLSVIFGATSFLLLRIYPLDFPKEILSLFLSVIGYICGEIYAKRIAKVV